MMNDKTLNPQMTKLQCTLINRTLSVGVDANIVIVLDSMLQMESFPHFLYFEGRTAK